MIEKEEERKRLVLEAKLEEKHREQERIHEMNLQQLQYTSMALPIGDSMGGG